MVIWAERRYICVLNACYTVVVVYGVFHVIPFGPIWSGLKASIIAAENGATAINSENCMMRKKNSD